MFYKKNEKRAMLCQFLFLGFNKTLDKYKDSFSLNIIFADTYILHRLKKSIEF